MRKELPQKLLRELLKNSKRSDRELAKVLGVSQPTITRARHNLEREGVIQDYTVVPDFKKMGFELMTITLVRLRPEVLSPEIMAKAQEYTAKFPGLILSSAGEGMGMNGMSIGFHKNYTEYQHHLNKVRTEWKGFLDAIKIFTIALGEGEYKRLSLTYLKDVPP